jgi:hypothetical protein
MKQYDVEIGKFYHFWDDGKSSISRHYLCKCEGIITVEESKELLFESYYWNEDNWYKEGNASVALTLYDIWTKNKEQCPWLYADDTPYFIVCSCPKFDNHNLYFVKTKDDTWFSMDVQTWWQTGLLDHEERKLKRIIEDLEDTINHTKLSEEEKERYREYINDHLNVKY